MWNMKHFLPSFLSLTTQIDLFLKSLIISCNLLLWIRNKHFEIIVLCCWNCKVLDVLTVSKELLRHISDLCHTSPLTQPLIISSLYPWNLISVALKHDRLYGSRHTSCVKVKRDFALILSGNQGVKVFFDKIRYNRMHEVMADGFMLHIKVLELAQICKRSLRPRSATGKM